MRLVKFYGVKLAGGWYLLIVDPFRFEFVIRKESGEPAPWSGIEKIEKSIFNNKIKNLILGGFKLYKI